MGKTKNEVSKAIERNFQDSDMRNINKSDLLLEVANLTNMNLGKRRYKRMVNQMIEEFLEKNREDGFDRPNGARSEHKREKAAKKPKTRLIINQDKDTCNSPSKNGKRQADAEHNQTEGKPVVVCSRCKHEEETADDYIEASDISDKEIHPKKKRKSAETCIERNTSYVEFYPNESSEGEDDYGIMEFHPKLDLDDDNEAECGPGAFVFELGSKMQVTIRKQWEGITMNITEFYKKNGKKVLHEEGMNFSPKHWRIMKKAIPLIEKSIKELEELND